VGGTFYTDGRDVHVGVEVFINLHNVGVRVDSRETEKTD